MRPSGPNAAPLGPPPGSAITVLVPSGATLVSRPPAISHTITLPSGKAIGPSGKSSPSVMTVTAATTVPPQSTNPSVDEWR